MVGQVWKVMPIILELRRPRQEVQELEDSGVACPCTCGGQGATGGNEVDQMSGTMLRSRLSLYECLEVELSL